jgi:transcriptional regulator with XRE-family HTH domain
MLTKQELGQRIKQARKIKAESEGLNRFTATDLAKALNVSQSYLSAIENGRKYPHYSMLSGISEVCGVPFNLFIDDQPASIPTETKAIPDEPDQYHHAIDAIIAILDQTGCTINGAESLLEDVLWRIKDTAVCKEAANVNRKATQKAPA